MALPDITLPRPYILLTQKVSAIGLLSFNNGNLRVGLVEKIYATSDRVQVGQSVIFDITKSQEFIYGSTIYNMVSDEFITGQENPPP